jgi:hypothetical protein
MWLKAVRKVPTGTLNATTASTPPDVSTCFQGNDRTPGFLLPFSGTTRSWLMLSVESMVSFSQCYTKNRYGDGFLKSGGNAS